MDNQLYFRGKPTTLQADDHIVVYLKDGTVRFERMSERLMIQKRARPDDKMIFFKYKPDPIDAVCLAELIAVTHGFGIEKVRLTEKHAVFRFTDILSSQR